LRAGSCAEVFEHGEDPAVVSAGGIAALFGLLFAVRRRCG
jgi:hypothetical protein